MNDDEIGWERQTRFNEIEWFLWDEIKLGDLRALGALMWNEEFFTKERIWVDLWVNVPTC